MFSLKAFSTESFRAKSFIRIRVQNFLLERGSYYGGIDGDLRRFFENFENCLDFSDILRYPLANFRNSSEFSGI